MVITNFPLFVAFKTDFPTRPTMYDELEEVINDALTLENSIAAALNQTEADEAVLQELNEKVNLCPY